MYMDYRKFRTPGRVLWVSKDIIYKSIGRNLFYSEDTGLSWKLRSRLPMTSFRSVSLYNSILSRFFRAGFHHLHVLDNNTIIVFANKSIYLLGPDSDYFQYVGAIKGSKPLCISVHEGVVVYGEYSRNVNRMPVPLYKSDDGGLSWFVPYTFEGIRHVHGVFFDKHSGKYWITTGDLDDECSIWTADQDFSRVEKVLTGAQKYRAVQLLFDRNFIYYGSDTPDGENHLYRLSKRTRRLECLSSVGAPVFFGQKAINHLFFSTAIEKSSHKNIDSAILWHSDDGMRWDCVASLGRSFLPLRIFQNGQILFPAGPGDDENLWFWSLATSEDNKSFRIGLADLDKDRTSK